MKINQKNKGSLGQPNWLWCVALAGVMSAASIGSSHAATLEVNSFGSAANVSPWYFQNWNGSTAAIAFSTDDANGSGSSGSMKLSIDFDATTKYGGAFRFNFTGDISAYDAIEYDVKVDPLSPVDQYGTAADVKMGFSDSGYGLHNTDLNVNPVATNGGWQHVRVPFASIGGTGPQPIPEVVCQLYDGNYTSAQTAIIYIDNIKFTGPDPTYPDFTAFVFDDSTHIGGLNGGIANPWYGGVVDVQWDSIDSSNNPSSGSARVNGTMTGGDNNCIMAWNFQTNQPINFYPAGYTNFIDGSHYDTVEVDVKWDNSSTMTLAQFNGAGDVSGFPVGLMEGQDNGGINNGIEALAGGATGITIPDEATNGWVHLSIPINKTAVGIADVTGLYFKKYDNSGGVLAGLTYGFWVDNVVFKGGALAIPRPTMTISKAIKGLNIINSSGSPYDRESLATFNYNYSFVNQANPVTYAINIAGFPSANYANYNARIYLVPNSAAVEAEPDYVEATLLMIDISRNGAGQSQAIIRGKVGAANGNGTLYDTSPTFIATNSPIIGNWRFTFTQNTNILVTAPDGSSGNLPVPLGLSYSDVSTAFGSDMVVYFGGYNNGGGNVGQRTVLASVAITNGATPASIR